VVRPGAPFSDIPAAWPRRPPPPPPRCRFLIVGSKLLPGPTGNPLVDFLRGDAYYSLLAPLTVPVSLVAVYLNWLALKFFRHN
jgi:hypothetical protein